MKPMLDPALADFDAQRTAFRWNIPQRFNIAVAVCDRHHELGSRTALFCETADGRRSRYTFAEIRRLSNRLANVLEAAGVGRGDRVAIVLPQRVEAALAHLATYKLGAIAVPLSILFGPDALEYRLADSGARAAIVDGERRPAVEELAGRLQTLETIIDCDDDGPSGMRDRLGRAADRFQCVDTAADDPALLIYTSGTTGPPKGALVAHRCLLGNLPGFELSQNFFPRPGDLFWTPADWAWTGGLIDALLPSWFYGVPVLGASGRGFDPERACRLLAEYRVRNAFIPPTALKMMRQLGNLRERFGVDLRSVMSAGEQMGAELLDWGREALGVEINEMWGQSEFNYIVGNCTAIMAARGGSMGRPYPGHRVEPLDADGRIAADNETGELCALRDDPVMFLGYWGNEQATRDKFLGDWWRTGDVGYRDPDGYLWFVGRGDDVISSAGYRIGPGEIEDCLLKHPAVAQAAAIGSPDPLRGEVVKAFIVLADGWQGSTALADEIRDSVRTRLAAYEYPREVEFIDALPLTTTGKVRRMELRERERRRKAAHAETRGDDQETTGQ